MTDQLDKLAEELQEQIFEETREAYGETAFRRWLQPERMGRLAEADGHGRVTGSCGDTIEVFLKFEEDRVRDSSFLTDGCGISGVCGSYAAELGLGKTAEEIIQVRGEDILAILGGLPEEDRHCAFLAVSALQEALEDYMRRARAANPGEKDRARPED